VQAVRKGVQAARAALAHAVVQGVQGADEEQRKHTAQRRQEPQLLRREQEHPSPPSVVFLLTGDPDARRNRDELVGIV
jgi:hypothetical protein